MWPKLVQKSIWHRLAIKNKKRLLDILSDNSNSKPLLVAILRSVFFPKEDDSPKILMHNFSDYVHSNYPKISFLNNIYEWRLLRANKSIKSIISWYYKVVYDNDSIICDECSSLMVPSFVKSGRFSCPDKNCPLFSIPIYENYCWRCFDDVSSINCNDCGSCEWVICINCGGCRDPRYGGECDEQFPVESKIVRPIYPYLLKSGTGKNKDAEGDDKKKVFNSVLFEEIYKNSINSYRYLPSNNMSSHNCNRGIKIIDKNQELANYLALYLPMHVAKLFRIFDNTENLKVLKQPITIYDWGCGQGIATLSLIEYAKIQSINLNIQNVQLIEPSLLAIQKAKLYIQGTDYFKNNNFSISLINKELNKLEPKDLLVEKNQGIHLFSNILDINGIDHKNIKELLYKEKNKKTIFITSPNYQDARVNIDNFVNGFQNDINMLYESKYDLKVYCKDFRSNKFRNRRVKNYSKVFELN